MKTLKLILTILIAVIALIGLILYIMILTDNSTGNGMIIAGEVLVIVTSAIALFFGIKNLATNPQALKKTLISLAVFAIIAILSYVAASDVIPKNLGDDIQVTATESKYVGTGIYMFYFLAAIAILSMIGFGIKKTLNK
ncbi:hypothetical protein C8N46_101538 [Kordia periserrulae]|uniref:Uncharacterized protein n=1 Tax=Kordia periserrulae TaxID=701523 RepID=A0A2T6C6I3_9FLAO|nr:hypothetical protein [Kordia periserrulae]PTX63929.1 hypothetical protein C8N46_101538 [Kordia periserrulae]